MSNRHWTKEQEEAISSRGKNLLLSAAAGSGKTAVLVERIIHLITDPEHPIDVNELLVLTFTKAAAAEMRTRITSALTSRLEEAELSGREKEGTLLSRQLSLMGSAHISTIDSFCQSLIRQYFYRLRLDPKSRVVSDENELYLLKQDVLSEVLLKWYAAKDASFEKLAHMFSRRFQDRELRRLILHIDLFSRSMAFPDEWISHLADPYRVPEGASLSDLPWTNDLLDKFHHLALSWTDSYRLMFQLMEQDMEDFEPYQDPLSKEYDGFSLLAEAENWDKWYELIESSAFFVDRLPTIARKKAVNPDLLDTLKPQITKLRDKVKKEFTAQIQPFFSIPGEEYLSQMSAMAPLVETLSSVTEDFQKAYQERKRSEGIMEFNDMEHYALELLFDRNADGFDPSHVLSFPSVTALELRKKYKEVMIDEYQDTNDVQETIAALISTDSNRFMVGDIKQSIYRFRMADPSIFRKKYKEYGQRQNPLCQRIDLNRNFRSDASVLYGINFIFRQILTEDQLELDYGPQESLYPGRPAAPASDTYAGGSITIDLLEQDEKEEIEELPQEVADMHRVDYEGRLIARHIQAMMDKGTQVMDKSGTLRPLRFSDIAILMRSLSSKSTRMIQTLQDMGIPAICEQNDDILETMEVRQLWSLLRILDNPRQDLPLTAILRSPWVGLDEQDLAHLMLEKKKIRSAVTPCLYDALPALVPLLSTEKAQALTEFFTHFNSWRAASRQDGVAPLLRTILEDTDFLTYVSGLPEGIYRRAHVLAFYDKALEWDNGKNHGLYGFLDNLHALSKEGRPFKTSISGSSELDAVELLTIHKSKGLEYPVVFLADAASPFNNRDFMSPYICDKTKGLGLYYYDEKSETSWPSLYWLSVRETGYRENLAEEARLLYVAMTRARDKLFITGTVKNAQQAADAWTISLPARTPIEGTPCHHLPSHVTAGARNYLDWIMPAAAGSRSMKEFWDLSSHVPVYENDMPGEQAAFTFHMVSRASLLTPEERGDASEKGKTVRENPLSVLSVSGNAPSWLEDRFQWSYAHHEATLTPAKITATTATRLLADAEDRPASIVLAEDIPDRGPAPLPPDFAAPPAFLNEIPAQASGTAYGTLMHKAMQYLDLTHLTPDRETVRQAVEQLAEKNVFSTEEKNILLMEDSSRHPVDDFITFLKSPLCSQMKRADTIHRELPFSILLPAYAFYPDCEKEEKIFLQGIIDCMLERDGHLTLIDYKTDHVRNPEYLLHHYTRQLRIYGYAMETILKKPVDQMFLWSFHMGQAIEVPRKKI
jgi:ATP-dependent helicase/nuclease subunit A